MNDKELEKFTIDYIENKIRENSNYLRITFYDIRVKNNLNEEESEKFMKLARKYLESNNFNVYFNGMKFVYKNANRLVQSNELIIAFKD